MARAAPRERLLSVRTAADPLSLTSNPHPPFNRWTSHYLIMVILVWATPGLFRGFPLGQEIISLTRQSGFTPSFNIDSDPHVTR